MKNNECGRDVQCKDTSGSLSGNDRCSKLSIIDCRWVANCSWQIWSYDVNGVWVDILKVRCSGLKSKPDPLTLNLFKTLNTNYTGRFYEPSKYRAVGVYSYPTLILALLIKTMQDYATTDVAECCCCRRPDLTMFVFFEHIVFIFYEFLFNLWWRTQSQ